jgi:hypothetical protein
MQDRLCDYCRIIVVVITIGLIFPSKYSLIEFPYNVVTMSQAVRSGRLQEDVFRIA